MTRDELRAALAHANVQAFLRVIREGESSQSPDAYRMLYGGGSFASFDDHPRMAFQSPWGWTSAAGAYQFMAEVPGKVKTDTWDRIAKKYGFSDFTPDTQDEAAVALIAERGALQDLLRGDLSEVLDKVSYEWASLPPGRYGQPTLDAKRVYSTFDKWLKPSEVIVAQPVKEPAMPAPFVGLALEALLTSIPSLIRHFGKGERSEENAKLAEVIVPIAKEAVGAVNEQDLIDKLGQPEVVAQIDQAVRVKWLDIVESGGGGLEGARAFNLAAANIPLQRQPAFIISCALMLFPLIMVVDVFFVHPGNFTSELRTQVVTGILLVISIVGAYWLGSSMSSRTKDELIARK